MRQGQAAVADRCGRVRGGAGDDECRGDIPPRDVDVEGVGTFDLDACGLRRMKDFAVDDLDVGKIHPSADLEGGRLTLDWHPDD